MTIESTTINHVFIQRLIKELPVKETMALFITGIADDWLIARTKKGYTITKRKARKQVVCLHDVSYNEVLKFFSTTKEVKVKGKMKTEPRPNRTFDGVSWCERKDGSILVSEGVVRMTLAKDAKRVSDFKLTFNYPREDFIAALNRVYNIHFTFMGYKTTPIAVWTPAAPVPVNKPVEGDSNEL